MGLPECLSLSDIFIRDPFVLFDNGIYYLYGTRSENFGIRTGGFDVYLSTDLVNWSKPKQVFCSEKYGMNREVNWAPEVHKYNGKYYMCATFTFADSDRRGTYILVSDKPDAEFVPHSDGSITPPEWYALDGSLYFDGDEAYMVFCHEHVQIKNGTVEYVKLAHDLKKAQGLPKTLFHGSDAYKVSFKKDSSCVTDGPFLYKSENGNLYMIWSTVDNGTYLQCKAVSDNGKLDGNWIQLPHLFDKDGGHGMLFKDDNRLMLSLHSPNKSGFEHPAFFDVTDSFLK